MRSRLATVVLCALCVSASSTLTACGGASPSAQSPDAAPGPAGDGGAKGNKTYPDAQSAPSYDGAAFAKMQIVDLEADAYLDEAGLLDALAEDRVVFFGEQHETAPVQELELWLLQRMTEKHADVSLAMEHFQHDEQPILDKYVAGAISAADFEKTSQPWPKYATYWKPLVEHMKSKSRPVVGLNVPDEALKLIYGAYPKKPLEVFNAWNDAFKYAGSIAPRPLAAYSATYKDYFAANFDYEAHAKGMGMTLDEALPYFTELAHIRDETMGYFVADALKSGGRVFMVAGDFHVQTGLATPERAARYAGDSPRYDLVTTTPKDKLDAVRAATVAGHKLARFVLAYEGG